MLTTASQFAPRARPLQARHTAAARVLGAAGLNQRQQTRGFRFGIWSSYLDDDFHREFRRRQRTLKHKYLEQINRRLSWDKHPFAEDARHALKRMMNSSWRSHDARPGGRYCDDVEPDKPRFPENEDGVRPGQNIEDVERGAMDHLMFGKDRQQSSFDQSAWCRRRFRRASMLHHPPYRMPIEQDDYVIDPITNRKVAKYPTSTTNPNDGADIPVKTFKDYRSQFAHPPGSSSSQVGSQQHFEDASSTEKHRRHDQSVMKTNPQGADEADFGCSRRVPLPEGDPEGDEFAQSHQFKQSRENQFNNPKFWEDSLLAAAPKHNDVQDHRSGLDHEATREAKEDIKYNDPHRCQPARHPEPDGKHHHSAEERAERSTDLHRHQYTSGSLRNQFEDLKPRYEDAEQFKFRELVAGEIAKRFEDVETRDAKNYQSARGDILSAQENAGSAYNDLDKDRGARHIESDGKTSDFEESGTLFPRQDQRPIERVEPDDFSEPTVEDLRGKYDQSELKKYTALRDLDRDGSTGPVPEELGNKNDPGKLNDVVESGPDFLPKQDQGAAARDEKSNFREMLDTLMKQHARLSDAVDEEASQAVKLAKTKAQHSGSSGRKLTGNFVRDFPEEFEKSWTKTLSSAPAEIEETPFLNGNQVEAENMDGGLEGAFGQPTPPRIQPALDRLSGKKPATNHVDPLSKEPSSSETLFAKECVGSAQPLLVKHYGSPPEARDADKKSAEESRHQAQEQKDAAENITSERDSGPTRYRILAYDPVMQKVNMAETTSLVPDFTSALSPADALLHLSQPLKFFPFFAALEAEGFEIVSGSGDVLIFRQARPSLKEKTTAGTNAERTSEEAAPEHIETPVNPIDMTGRVKIMSPASANFASPTGYVNYDNLLENEAGNLPPPPPRVKYNIDLRREEPVYSGPKYRADGGRKPKKGMVKRLLVGGVWVAGISYGLGVVSEYFITGGVDGMGPKGF